MHAAPCFAFSPMMPCSNKSADLWDIFGKLKFLKSWGKCYLWMIKRNGHRRVLDFLGKNGEKGMVTIPFCKNIKLPWYFWMELWYLDCINLPKWWIELQYGKKRKKRDCSPRRWPLMCCSYRLWKRNFNLMLVPEATALKAVSEVCNHFYTISRDYSPRAASKFPRRRSDSYKSSKLPLSESNQLPEDNCSLAIDDSKTTELFRFGAPRCQKRWHENYRDGAGEKQDYDVFSASWVSKCSDVTRCVRYQFVAKALVKRGGSIA